MKETRAPSILSQTLLSFFGLTSGYIVAIIAGIVVARALGPAGKGIAAYAALVLGVFATYASGIQSTVMYQCGHKHEDYRRVYGASMQLIGVLTIPAALILFAVALLNPAHAELAYVACALPFAVYNQLAAGFFLLKNDVRSTIIQGGFNTFGVALFTIPALLLFHGGLESVLRIWALMFVASGIYAFVRLNTYVPTLSIRSSWQIFREHVWFSFRSGCSSLANFLNLRVDVFVVSIMLDARALGIYTLALASGELIWQVSRPLVWTTMARIASADEESAIELAAKVSRNILAVQAIIGTAIFVAAPFAIQLVYGRAFSESAVVIRWLMPGMILYNAHSSLGYFVAIKKGKPAISLAIQTVSILACATITAMTIHRLNIFGAALATSVTYCFVAAANAALFYRYTQLSPLRFILLQREDLDRVRRLIAGIATRGSVRNSA